MRDVRLYLITALLVGSTVSWRHGVYFSGGLDPVVAGKALMGVVALGLAMLASRRTLGHLRFGTMSAWMLGCYLLASLFGAWSGGTLFASAVLVIRLLIVAATVLFLLQTAPIPRLLQILVNVIGWLAVLAAVSGLPRYRAEGRLFGGIPPLQPNELALLCGITVVAIFWRDINSLGRWYDGPILAFMLGTTWLTGSRTGLAALMLALAVIVVQARRLPAAVFLLLTLLLPVIGYVVFGTNLVSHYLDRGGSAEVGTLSQRTVAWTAAIHGHTGFWQQWFGGGLSVRKIPVVAKYRNVQGLDSSWISALVQAGVLGLLTLSAWSLANLRNALAVRGPLRQLSTGILLFIVGRSFLESGLLDATPSFLFFLLIGMLVEGGTEDGARGAFGPATVASALGLGSTRARLPVGGPPSGSKRGKEFVESGSGRP